MCDTCGCGSDHVHVVDAKGKVYHVHPAHGAEKQEKKYQVVDMGTNILDKNDRMAERLKGYFEARNILAINLVSSPGSGKTTLLEQTLKSLPEGIEARVIEGDQQTSQDANRIKATGTEAIQINTGKGCHLDAEMIHKAVQLLDPPADTILFIENVGNLVCPALFDLGETLRVVIISVTEGEDKPLKYPDMFRSAQVCIINKTDLLPYVPFDTDQFREYASTIQPDLQFLETDAWHGAGIDNWISLLMAARRTTADV